MSNRVIAIRLGSPVTFSDRWQGRVSALEVDEAWEVLNVVVTRGILRWQRSVKLPFSASRDWSDAYISFDCTSGQAFAREIPPIAAPARPLSTNTPITLPRARLSSLLVSAADRIARALLIREMTGARRLLEVPVNEAAFEEKTLMVLGQARSLSTYQSDGEIHTAVRLALNGGHLKPDDRSAITIVVSDGVASLRGNVRTKAARDLAEHAARSVKGVVAVKNEVIDDTTLEIALGQLLERSSQQQSSDVYARSSLGEVTLFGYAPSARAADEIARTVSRTPGVRTVNSRLEIATTEAAGTR